MKPEEVLAEIKYVIETLEENAIPFFKDEIFMRKNGKTIIYKDESNDDVIILENKDGLKQMYKKYEPHYGLSHSITIPKTEKRIFGYDIDIFKEVRKIMLDNGFNVNKMIYVVTKNEVMLAYKEYIEDMTMKLYFGKMFNIDVWVVKL